MKRIMIFLILSACGSKEDGSIADAISGLTPEKSIVATDSPSDPSVVSDKASTTCAAPVAVETPAPEMVDVIIISPKTYPNNTDTYEVMNVQKDVFMAQSSKICLGFVKFSANGGFECNTGAPSQRCYQYQKRTGTWPNFSCSMTQYCVPADLDENFEDQATSTLADKGSCS